MATSSDKETPNREFDRQMRRFKRAFEVPRPAAPDAAASGARCAHSLWLTPRVCGRRPQPGTEEYAIRKAYPGPEAAARRCDNPECLNTDFPVTTTYWLCDECSAVRGGRGSNGSRRAGCFLAVGPC